MWGNLAIEETIDVVHRGAQLKVTLKLPGGHLDVS